MIIPSFEPCKLYTLEKDGKTVMTVEATIARSLKNDHEFTVIGKDDGVAVTHHGVTSYIKLEKVTEGSLEDVLKAWKEAK